eukprot:990424-Rhodomonas_salina.1
MSCVRDAPVSALSIQKSRHAVRLCGAATHVGCSHGSVNTFHSPSSCRLNAKSRDLVVRTPS